MNKPNQPKALVIIAHGSSLQSANNEVLQLSQSLKQKLSTSSYFHITTCFLEIATPDLKSCIRDMMAHHPNTGIEVDIMPYFLSSGKHVERDIPNQIAALQTEYPNITFKLFDYIGKNGALLNFLIECIQSDCSIK